MIINKTHINLLSIDGGGVKGIIPSQILYRIEKELGINIYNYFDMFTGTSVGSMIITSIVYGKDKGSDLTTIFSDKDANKIMKRSFLDKILNVFQLKPKYNGFEKSKLIEKNLGPLTMVKDTDKYVYIPAFNYSKKQTYFFKSWDGDTTLISKIVDASSAAPGYFPGVKIYNDYYIDGGISINNPTDSALAELININSNYKIKILSLGCGKKNKDNNKSSIIDWGGIQWFLKGKLFKLLLEEPEKIVHHRTKLLSKNLGYEYLRIDGEIENTSIDDTSDKNLKKLRMVADEWFETNKNDLKQFFK